MPAFVTVGQAAVGRADSGVSALVVRLGETRLTTFNHPAVKTVVGQADAAKGLRQHAGFAAGDHRVGEEQVTGLQFGIEGTHFQGAARRRERTWRFAVAIADRQDARIISAATTVELEPEHGVGINTETDGALGVTRFEEAEETLAPFNVVVRLLQAVAVHVVVTGVEVEARAFNKTFGV